MIDDAATLPPPTAILTSTATTRSGDDSKDSDADDLFYRYMAQAVKSLSPKAKMRVRRGCQKLLEKEENLQKNCMTHISPANRVRHSSGENESSSLLDAL